MCVWRNGAIYRYMYMSLSLLQIFVTAETFMCTVSELFFFPSLPPPPPPPPLSLSLSQEEEPAPSVHPVEEPEESVNGEQGEDVPRVCVCVCA